MTSKSPKHEKCNFTTWAVIFLRTFCITQIGVQDLNINSTSWIMQKHAGVRVLEPLQNGHFGHFWSNFGKIRPKWPTCLGHCELKTLSIEVNENMNRVYFTSTYWLYGPFLHTQLSHRVDLSENHKIIYCAMGDKGRYGFNDSDRHEIHLHSFLYFIWSDLGQKWP